LANHRDGLLLFKDAGAAEAFALADP